jgi:outer membrane receptor protein involved in Fe transport
LSCTSAPRSPHCVSNDNAFVESLFCTAKCQSGFSVKGFATLWCIDDNSVASVFYTDLNFNYKPSNIEGLHLFASVQNLFDRGPPLTPAAIGRTGPAELSPIIHDQIGRRYTFGVNYQF